MAEALKSIQKHGTANRVLRCTRTMRFWTSGGWTAHPGEATAFADEMEAVRKCVENGLRDIELVLLMPGNHTELFATTIR